MEGEKRRIWHSRSESLHDLDHHDAKPARCTSRGDAILWSAESRGCVVGNKQSKNAVLPVAHLNENRLITSAPYFGGIDWYMQDSTALRNGRGRASRSLSLPLTVWQERRAYATRFRFAVAIAVGDLDLARGDNSHCDEVSIVAFNPCEATPIVGI